MRRPAGPLTLLLLGVATLSVATPEDAVLRCGRLSDLECYAREAKRLFSQIPGWFSAPSEGGEGSRPHPHHPSRARPSYDVSERTGNVKTSPRMGVADDRPPFAVEGGPPGVEDWRVASSCLRDRYHVTAVFQQCIYGQVAVAGVATPPGSVEAFLRNCRATPRFRRCIRTTVLERLERCMDEGIAETIENVELVTQSIITLICRHEADRVAVFLTDGGLDCWRRVLSSGHVLLCLNANLAGRLWESLADLPSLTDAYGHLDLAESCVHQQVETCTDPYSVHVVGILFGNTREVSACAAPPPPPTPPAPPSTTPTPPAPTIPTPTPTPTSASTSSPPPQHQTSEVFVVVVICVFVLTPVTMLLRKWMRSSSCAGAG